MDIFLTLDAGNTRTKCTIFSEDGRMVASVVTGEDDYPAVVAFTRTHAPRHGIITTTGRRSWDFAALELPGTAIELSHETPLPIQLVYVTPHTLGRDRIAAACGAHALYPGKNCLVVSAGTCVTMDMLLASGTYLGGNIAPGLRMRLKAMHDGTASLPMVEPGWPELFLGNTTLHALQNGAALGIVMEIEGLIQRARDAFGEVICVMSGGDSAFLAERLENRIFAEPELVTHGLFQILKLNVKNQD